MSYTEYCRFRTFAFYIFFFRLKCDFLKEDKRT